MTNTISDLTTAQLIESAENIVAFYDFTFFAERSTTASEVLVFILEYQCVALGLVNFDSEIDSAELMTQYVMLLDNVAQENDVKYWSTISQQLPYKQ